MRRAVRILVVVLIWAPVVFVAGRYAAGDAADFSGFDVGGNATAAAWIYDQPSLGIPGAKHAGEVNVAYSESNLISGPSSYGLASIAWPGQFQAALPGAIQSQFESQCECELPQKAPNYPVRAETFYPQGPYARSSDAGTATMRSRATQTSSDANSHINALGFPGIGDVGNQTSFSSSGFDPTGVVAMVEAAASDVTLFNDLITFDSVVSRATARSDGERGSLAGGTTITGAKIADTPVVIDASGVRIADGEGPAFAPAQQALNQLLAERGIAIEISQPVDTIQGPRATRALGGLLIRMESRGVEPLISALPDELEKEIRDEITFDHGITVQLASAAVTAGAAKVIEFPTVEPPTTDVASAGGAAGDNGSGSLDETAVGESGPSTIAGRTTTTGGGSAGGPVAIDQTRATSSGVPLWLVAVLMVVAFASSRPLTAAADRLLAVGGARSRCPAEES